MENIALLRKKIETESDKNIDIFKKFKFIINDEEFDAFEIYCNNSESSNKFFGALFDKILLDDKVSSIVDGIDRNEFIDICDLLLGIESRRILFSNELLFSFGIDTSIKTLESEEWDASDNMGDSGVLENRYNADEIDYGAIYATIDDYSPNQDDTSSSYSSDDDFSSVDSDKMEEIEDFLENLKYSIISKRINDLVNSIKLFGFDNNKFNISFMDLNQFENGEFLNANEQKRLYINNILHKLDNGKINIFLVFGAKKCKSIHSNILIYFNGICYSIDTSPGLNHIPSLLENEVCLCNNRVFTLSNEDRFAILQSDTTSCIKKSLTLITYLADILNITSLETDIDIIVNFLKFGLVAYGDKQIKYEELENVDRNNKIFFSAPLYAVPISDFLYLKIRLLSYLLKERQYLQLLSNSNEFFSQRLSGAESEPPKSEYSDIENLRVKNVLETYNYGSGDIILDTGKLIEINDRLLNSAIYSIRGDLDAMLLRDFNFTLVNERENRLETAMERLNSLSLEKVSIDEYTKRVKSLLDNILENLCNDTEKEIGVGEIFPNIKESINTILKNLNSEEISFFTNSAMIDLVDSFDDMCETRKVVCGEQTKTRVKTLIRNAFEKIELELNEGLRKFKVKEIVEILDILDSIDDEKTKLDKADKKDILGAFTKAHVKISNKITDGIDL